jgi:hypothetical protein
MALWGILNLSVQLNRFVKLNEVTRHLPLGPFQPLRRHSRKYASHIRKRTVQEIIAAQRAYAKGGRENIGETKN